MTIALLDVSNTSIVTMLGHATKTNEIATNVNTNTTDVATLFSNFSSTSASITTINGQISTINSTLTSQGTTIGTHTTSIATINTTIGNLNSTYQSRSEKGALSGYAGLDSTGKLSVGNIPDISSTYQIRSEKGTANGYASLDATGKILASVIPVHNQTASTISDSTTSGRALLTAANTSVQTSLLDLATPTAKGLMSSSEKVKLTGLPAIFSGALLQKKIFTNNTYATYNTQAVAIVASDVVPTTAMGNQIWSVTFTPTTTGSTIFIRATIHCDIQTDVAIVLAMFTDLSANAISTSMHDTYDVDYGSYPVIIEGMFTAPNTATRTISIRMGNQNTTYAMYVNGPYSGRKYGGTVTSTMIIEELVP